MYTGSCLLTYPRGSEASLPGKVSLTSSYSSSSGSYYPRLALFIGEGTPFWDATHHSAGPSMQICPPSSLTTGGGIEIYRLCYIGYALMEKISPKQTQGRNFPRVQLLSIGVAMLKKWKAERELCKWTLKQKHNIKHVIEK